MTLTFKVVLLFYRSAYTRNPKHEFGQAGVHAAYLLDILGDRAEQLGQGRCDFLGDAGKYRQEARDIRERLVVELNRLAEQASEHELGQGHRYRCNAALAELYFGLKRYDEARRWLEYVRADQPSEGKRRMMFKRLTELARLQHQHPPAEGSAPGEWSQAWQAIAKLLDDSLAERILCCPYGRTGLALMGSGLRDALFHLGVLARLADSDALRSIEVISAASGACLVGVLYYLEVRHLLQAKPDSEITRQDYIGLVQRVLKQFLSSEQHNLRALIFADSFKIVRPDGSGQRYTSVQRLAERNASPPEWHNWERRAKVPVLLLHSTDPNTGQHWQFTAQWRGESAGLIAVDKEDHVYYPRGPMMAIPMPALPSAHHSQAITAVKAVSDQPESILFGGIGTRESIRLCGGVTTDLALQGLLERACTFPIISNGGERVSGNEENRDIPWGRTKIAQELIGERVRQLATLDLQKRCNNRSLMGFVDIDGQDSRALNAGGIDAGIADHIAGLGKDFDSYTEVEAYSLMLSGYLQTEERFKQQLQEQAGTGSDSTGWMSCDGTALRGDWPFLQLEAIAGLPPDSADPRRQELVCQLAAGRRHIGEIWEHAPALKRYRPYLLGAVVLAILVAAYGLSQFLAGLHAYWRMSIVLLMIVGLVCNGSRSWLFPDKKASWSPCRLLDALIRFAGSQGQLWLFEKQRLERGKLQRLLDLRE